MSKKNSKLYTNGIEEKYFTESDIIPEGYTLSKVFYINDGVNNKRWTNKNTIPEGFVEGKLPLSRNWTEDQHGHHSEETKLKISESRKKQGNYWEGKHHSEESKKKMSDSRKGVEPYNKGILLSEEEKIQRDQNIIEKYGSLEEFYKISSEKCKYTKLEKYGDPNYNNREKAQETCLENFGVAYYCMTDDFRKGHGNTSIYNTLFENLLKVYNIEYSKEFPLNTYLYDFKIDNILIEINPWVTHNSTIGVYNKPPKDKNYHINKFLEATKNSYKCICLWSWDNFEKFIISISKPTIFIKSKDCLIKEVNEKEANNFLNLYTLQEINYNQSIRLGLFYKNELVQIMTFNKNNYELTNFCTKFKYNIEDNYKKLFKYFLDVYKPNLIISYCDNSKLVNNIYDELNFKLKSFGVPARHLYNPKTNEHFINDLFKILDKDFVEIYDCGKSTFIQIISN